MKKIGLGFWLYGFYLLVIALIAWTLVDKSLDSIEQSVSQSAEEVMVDAASLLAELVSAEVENNVIKLDRVKPLISHYMQRPLQAKIYNLQKTQASLHIYITDAQGIVLFDSSGRFTGKDFSRWHDVARTLKGEYGARASLFSPDKESGKGNSNSEKALYVAAPVYAQNKIIGVVTVYKSIRNLDNFIQQQTDTLTQYAIIIFIAFLFFGGVFVLMFSRSVQKLVQYANALAQGKKTQQPVFRQYQLQTLSDAIKHMRDELDGKEYVENYIHLMAHELKTPITGIQNAAELLLDPMPEDKRKHFSRQILDSTQRMTRLIEYLLRLAALEQKDTLENTENFCLNEVLQSCIAQQKSALQKKNITVTLNEDKKLTIHGDKLLVEQAISNILDNAIDFSFTDSTLNISLEEQEQGIMLSIEDQGMGIPDYAQPKLFDRFFSLPRPDTKKKSTGLGLRFVKEIMELHRGSISIKNQYDRENNNQVMGVKVELLFSRTSNI